jgi:hypothetical protein
MFAPAIFGRRVQLSWRKGRGQGNTVTLNLTASAGSKLLNDWARDVHVTSFPYPAE